MSQSITVNPPSTVMRARVARGLERLVPRSLFSRSAMIIVAGFAIGQLLTFALIAYERGPVLRPPGAEPVLDWLVWAHLLQWLALAVCAWYMVRLVTRPLGRLAAAADDLGPSLETRPLAEAGPLEVANAARAFNAMQRRITGCMAERIEILAAIAHDLQTPITRLRLRADLMDNAQDRDKFRRDLDAMNQLVREGVTYARTLHGVTEAPCRVDADALFESIVADYADAGARVSLSGRFGEPLLTRPIALRRILINLIDNALKFGSDVGLRVQAAADGLVVSIVDNGPGIPPDRLWAVLQPFYRLESAAHRSTAGTGLGLAIAHQLAVAMGAELRLENRMEGGLEARLSLAGHLALRPDAQRV